MTASEPPPGLRKAVPWGLIVTIGLEPDRIKNLPHIKDLLKTLTGTDPASVDAALAAPGTKPNYFVPVATVPYDERYRTVLRPQLFPVRGVFFQRSRSFSVAFHSNAVASTTMPSTRSG